MGREPRSVTRHHYDKQGRLVRSVTTREPLWTDEDVAWATAFRLELKQRCPGPCGLPLSETTAMENGRPKHTYRVPEPARCQACDALVRDEEKTKDRRRPEALLRHVERTCDC